MRFQIHQEASISVSFAPGPIIDSDKSRLTIRRSSRLFGSPQHGIGAGTYANPLREAATCLAAKSVTDHADRLRESQGLLTSLGCHSGNLLDEGLADAILIPAAKSFYLNMQFDGFPLPGEIPQHTPVMTVNAL